MPKESGQKANWLELESSEGHLTAPVGGRVEEGHIMMAGTHSTYLLTTAIPALYE